MKLVEIPVDIRFAYQIFREVVGDNNYGDMHIQGVLDSVNALKERSRLVLWYTYAEGMTQGELSEEFGISRARVGQIFYSAIDELKKNTSRK